MSQDQSIDTIWFVAAIVLALSALFARRLSLGAIVRSVLGWVVIGAVVYGIVDHRDQLSDIAARIGLSDQKVVGDTTRIKMSPDGHFWARVELNGVERRMLIDSGATTTALSQRTADEAGIKTDGAGFPVMLDTANGTVVAKRATIERVQLGNLESRDLGAVVSDHFGDLDVIGMNFLSQLGSWRVEGRTLIMQPKQQPDDGNSE